VKQIDPLRFFKRLKWIDESPLMSVVEPYRQKIFTDALYMIDGARPQYNLILTGRAKKNWKSADLILAALYRLLAWKSPGGNQCYILANDEDQAGDNLELAKKLIAVNPVLDDAVDVRQKLIERKDAKGFLDHAFVDMSGGSSDDATLGIAHRDTEGRAILDRIMDQGQRPPFDPRKAIDRFANVLKEYGLRSVVGDAYAGETFRSDFQGRGISYRVSELTKSEIYEEVEPLLNGGRIVLLDIANLESQLLGLVWRGGKIDHPSGEHDDYANATAGALYLASKNQVFNPRAIPTGVGRGIGWELRKLPGGSTLSKPNPFRDIDDEPSAKVNQVFRFRWGWGNDE
jgi:hypothetical protein